MSLLTARSFAEIVDGAAAGALVARTDRLLVTGVGISIVAADEVLTAFTAAEPRSLCRGREEDSNDLFRSRARSWYQAVLVDQTVTGHTPF